MLPFSGIRFEGMPEGGFCSHVYLVKYVQRMEISTRWKLIFCLHEHFSYCHARFPPASFGLKNSYACYEEPCHREVWSWNEFHEWMNSIPMNSFTFLLTLSFANARSAASASVAVMPDWRDRTVWFVWSNGSHSNSPRQVQLYSLFVISHSTWWAIGVLHFPKRLAISMLMDCSSHPIDIIHIPSIGWVAFHCSESPAN